MPRKPDERIEKARQLFQQGKKLVDIARELDLPEGTVRRWKSTHHWKSERSEKNTERSERKRGGQPGNKNATGPPGNKNAEKYGFFSKYLPDETREIFSAIEQADPLDLLWHQIQIAYAAIIRAQRIAYVKDQKDVTKERIGSFDNGDTYSFQQAWDKQNEFLKAQARAQSELRSLIRQYDEMLHENWELSTEEQKARVELMKAQQQKAEAEIRQKEPVTEEQEHLDPHDLIIPSFWELYDDDEHEHQIVTSGRAGTKSSFAGILAIDTICREEPAAVVVLRKRHNKIRKTVYKEMIRAITRMGLKKSDFDIGITPMEIRCNRTGNVIYFSGSDSIDDTKGIIDEDKPIKLVILDELTEFFDAGEGEEELTNIEATFVRGNDEGFRMLYLYNPPKNPNAPINVWCRKMELRPDAVHVHVDYREVPVSWIGRKLIESAEQLRDIDLKQYRWVWLGEQTGIDETIYYMFRPEHVEEPPKGRYIIGIGGDYGQQNATTFQAFGLDIGKKKLRGLGEYYHSGRESGHQKSPSEYAEEFKAFAEDVNKRYGNGIIYLYLDPSAKGLAEEIKRKCSFVRIKDAENDVALGISRVQKVLTYDVLMVSKDQENAIREFGTYMYDKDSLDKGKEVPVKIDDHCVDAIRYAVMGLWTKLKYFLPEGARGEKE